MQPHDRPQAAGERVQRREQHPGLQRDPDRPEPGRLRIAQMGRTEDQRADGYRDPAAQGALDEPEQDAAEGDLLGDRRRESETEQCRPR